MPPRAGKRPATSGPFEIGRPALGWIGSRVDRAP
jgi:hypothetical protein